MKMTFEINDALLAELEREAVRQCRTTSELVETALRLQLCFQRERQTLLPLPTFEGGGALVDIADRDALYDAMDGDVS
jgi:hypothetical protein